MFDEESDNHKSLLSLSEWLGRLEGETTHTLHALATDDSISLMDDITSLKRTLTRIVKKSRANMQEKREAMVEERRRNRDPLQPWLDSDSQFEIRVAWHDHPGDEDEFLGFVKGDLNIPAGLARQLLARYLWFELNQKKGGNFVFKLGSEEDTLDVQKEENVKMDSLIVKRMNSATQKIEYILFIRPDPENAKVGTIEPFDWETDEKFERIIGKKRKKKSEDFDDDDNDEDKKGDGEAEETKFKNAIEQKERCKEMFLKFKEKCSGGGDDEDAALPDDKDEEAAAREEVETAEEVDNNEGGPIEGTAASSVSEWEALEDDEGNSFWYNSKTGESTYDKNSLESQAQIGDQGGNGEYGEYASQSDY